MSPGLSNCTIALSAVLLLGGYPSATTAGGHRLPSGDVGDAAAIVGAWIVEDDTAPFPFHMYVFNADGTLQQANPDAGDAKTSDSDGKGVWVARGGRIRGKWVEITADRVTHRFVGRLEVTFSLKVQGDRLAGARSATPFDANGRSAGGPFVGPFTGTRVTLP